MAKKYIFIRKDSEIVIGNKILKTGDCITLKDIKEIEQAETCEYLEEKIDE